MQPILSFNDLTEHLKQLIAPFAWLWYVEPMPVLPKP